MKIEVIKIDDLRIHEHHLEIIYSVDNFKFSTKLFYHDLSFSRLRETYSRQIIDRIAAHIALFEGMKLCSLFPKYYDVSLFEAETLLNHFIQENLLSNFTYFSILQPIYDFRIFKNLARYPEIVPKIHSCNIQKPWCKKCPKCAYVWLGLMANLPTKIVDSIFQRNLFDDPDLFFIFQQLLGLTEHSSFECIGEISESRLYMKKCLEKGLSGQVVSLFQEKILSDDSIDWQKLEQKYDQVYQTEHTIPGWIFNQIQTQF